MKFLCRIKKCEKAGLLFFVVCVVQAAPITERDSQFLDKQLEDYALVIDEKNITLDDSAAFPRVGIEQLQNNREGNKEYQQSPDAQLDKPKATSVDLYREQEQFIEDNAFFAPPISNEINSGGWTSRNGLPNEFQFESTNTGSGLLNQNEIIQNGQQLKMLAHNIFGEEMLEDILIAQQDVKMLVNQADAWIKDVLFDDSNWRLEDSIYGSAAVMFINDSSLISFLKKLDGSSDDINQIRKQLEQQNDSHKDSKLETDSEMVQAYFSIMEFWNNNASTLIYLVLSIVIVAEGLKLISKTLQPKEKRKSRRGSRRISRRGSTKKRASTSSLSAQGGVVSNSITNSGVARVEKQQHTSRRHHHNRRRRVKRSWVRKVLDGTFAGSRKNH